MTENSLNLKIDCSNVLLLCTSYKWGVGGAGQTKDSFIATDFYNGKPSLFYTFCSKILDSSSSSLHIIVLHYDSVLPWLAKIKELTQPLPLDCTASMLPCARRGARNPLKKCRQFVYRASLKK